MKIEVPAGHQVGMKVPKGGSDCAKCEYVRNAGTECAQKNFQKWNGGSKLPEPADEYCCDFFTTQMKPKTAADLRKKK